MTIAEVRLWGRTIGAVSWNSDRNLADFEYVPEFVSSNIQVAPLTMPLGSDIYSFPALPVDTFHGLPGMLADSLPDDFGNALINRWLADEGREPGSFNPVERLCYTGSRGMGALEYSPISGPSGLASEPVDIAALVDLAGEILSQRKALAGEFTTPGRQKSLQQILSIGTSAGGARAKALVAWNPTTNEVRSGQIDAGDGFSYWILKFDGVRGNKDKELEDPHGYGLVELAYHYMAVAAGIDMNECQPLRENGRAHFMARRFDRTGGGKRLHMQSLGAMAHFDFKQAGGYSYEQAMRTIRKLDMPMSSVEQQFRRAAFNIVARNQDDHVKNIAFLMDRGGNWSLSPAYDVTYSYNPDGVWTGRHQMSLNGKRDNFSLEDFRACAKAVSMKRGRAEDILEQVTSVVREWRQFAERAGVPEDMVKKIANAHRMEILGR